MPRVVDAAGTIRRRRMPVRERGVRRAPCARWVVWGLAFVALLSPSVSCEATKRPTADPKPIVRTARKTPGTPDAPHPKAFGLPGDADASRGRYAELVSRIAGEATVDPDLVRAIITVESNFDATAVSRKGARGLMQLMPGTAARYAIADVHDPEENLRGGIRHLRFLQDMFPDQLPLALAAYNAGESAVLRHNGIPPYRETREYVDRVLALYGRSTWNTDVPRRPPLAEPAAERVSEAAPPTPGLFRIVDPDGSARYTNVMPARTTPLPSQ
jgi:soluble lytic murein transglycosylase-like protein